MSFAFGENKSNREKKVIQRKRRCEISSLVKGEPHRRHLESQFLAHLRVAHFETAVQYQVSANLHL